MSHDESFSQVAERLLALDPDVQRAMLIFIEMVGDGPFDAEEAVSSWLSEISVTVPWVLDDAAQRGDRMLRAVQP